ncbi:MULTISPECIES: hypothetical protein [unclassified Nocardioides]|uniref:hypothetical protein n=1 Tax=unclassified Nocardioides TaxID=2615069 RepID=UPI0006FE7DF0|nr:MULTISPECIES: hypothetical protein [unclassified Nocardioides]KRA38969.1 hypothetical protein ASD81_10415 [Nocardioides sp. Root614]KRA92928.1 hypothetical protein ASD84_10680 [Nocardioides sp. Root682]
MTRRVGIWLAHVVAWSLLVTGVTVLYLRHQDVKDDGAAEPSAAKYASMPFASTLSLDGAGQGMVGSTFRFSAEGFSNAGIAAVTLYDGARVIDTVAPGGSGQIPLVLPALSVGRHTVHAAVTDKDGKVSQTAPVQVLVGVAPGKDDVPVEVPTLPDETLDDVATRIGVPATNLLVDRKVVRAGQPIPIGTHVFATIPPDAGVGLLTGNSPVITPGAAAGDFELTASLDDAGGPCAVVLETSGAKGEVTFYRAGGTSAGWVQFGKPKANGWTAGIDLAPGTHVFFARSGGLDSNQVSVVVPESCAASSGWTGDASIVDGELILPPGTTGSVFLLLSVDGQTWQRLPASQDELIAVGERTSIAHLLPALAGNRLQLQVIRITEASALTVASGELVLDSDRTIASVIGEPSALSLSVKGPDGPTNGIQLASEDKSLDFTWTGASKATTRVRWQVLSSVSGSGNLSLNPPGLLASGVSEVSGDGADGGVSGTFTINTADLPRADKPAAGSGKGTGGTALALKPLSLGGPLSDKPDFASIVPVSDLDVVAPPVELPVEGSTVHVRVVAVEGPAAAAPSVFLTLPHHQSATGGVDFNVNSVKVDVGRAPNPKYAGCLDVKVPWGPGGLPFPSTANLSHEALLAYGMSRLYQVPGSYCPGAFPPPKACDEWYCKVGRFIRDAAGVVVGVVVELYSLVSHAYNSVISTVVDVLTQLNPVCAVLGAAGEGEAAKDCTTVTGYATNAAITAVLASVGLPPSLPSGEELEAIAAGELDKLAVIAMKQFGVPCDTVKAPAGFDDALEVAGDQLNAPVIAAAADPCAAVAHLLIGTVATAAKASAQESAAAASGLPYVPGIAGFTMTPDPRSATDPLKVEVSLTVRDTDADTTGLVCTVRVRKADRPGNQDIGPYWTFTIPLEPVGNGRTFKGAGGSYPHASPSALTAGTTYDVDVREEQPTGCRFADQTQTVSLRAPDQ